MKTTSFLLYDAWKKLIAAYLLSFFISLAVGSFLVTVLHVAPESLYNVSTQRLSVALPVLTLGVRWGIDFGILLFLWNTMAALLTISFAYTAAWFVPNRTGNPPGFLKKMVCGNTRMKLLCYLPGCARMKEEPLRRLFVWVMVPLCGMVLLGIESGIAVSTGARLLGSFFSAFIALVPHGLVEIPALALAGAVPFSANLLMRHVPTENGMPFVFQQVETHRKAIPLFKITGCVIAGLFIAGLVEAHVTQRIVNSLL